MRSSPNQLLRNASLAADRLFWANGIGYITPRQLAVLVTVADDEGIHLTAVKERTGIDRSTTSDVVERLVRKGLLQKRRSRQDSRAFSLNLTDEGRKVLAAAEPVARRVDARLLRTLPPDRRGPFLEALRAIVRALEG
jgi:DNA-binding MarR family transcriptional regulator